MQLGMLLRKVGLAKNVTDNHRFYVGCHILSFSFVKILFVWCIAQMGVANNQNSKKNLRTGALFANFYVYFVCMNLMGIRKMGEIGLKMARSNLLPSPV